MSSSKATKDASLARVDENSGLSLCDSGDPFPGDIASTGDPPPRGVVGPAWTGDPDLGVAARSLSGIDVLGES